MTTEIESPNDVKPGTSRWRRLSAAAGIAALTCGGTLLAAASPASADTPVCGYYHSWTECINYSSGVLSVTAYNGYGVSEVETLWLNSYYYGPVSIPSGGSAGFGYSTGGPIHACAGIDSVEIVCGNF